MAPLRAAEGSTELRTEEQTLDLATGMSFEPRAGAASVQ